jgi:pimeloyl-ACP methyl ester carboxylesterase
LRLWLAEENDTARRQEAQLSPVGKSTVENLFRYQLAPIQNELFAEVQNHAQAMDEVSPHGKLGSLKVDVFLLHGAEDDVIPSSETLWLENEIPRAYLKAVLITPAVAHVDPEAQIKLHDQWQLISFMAAVFRELEHERRAAVESRVVPSAQEKSPSSR